MILHENRLLADDSHEILYHTFFIRKLGNMSEKLSSAAVLYCHSYFARFRKLQTSVTCTPAVVRKMSYSGCDLKLCDFIAKLWSSIHVPFQLPCGGSGFYSDVVQCLPLDSAVQVRFPPRAVGIFLHPVTPEPSNYSCSRCKSYHRDSLSHLVAKCMCSQPLK